MAVFTVNGQPANTAQLQAFAGAIADASTPATFAKAFSPSLLPPVYNLVRLDRWNRFLGKPTGQFDINILTDSYGQSPTRYTDALVRALQADFGNAGGGWVGAGYPPAGQASVNGSARYADYPVTFSGTWAANYNTAVHSPDICAVSSAVAGSRVNFGFPPGTTGVNLLWGGTTTNVGTVRYSLDGGTTWTNLSLNSSSGVGNTLIAGIPAGAFTLIVEVVGTNTCRISGCYTWNGAPGVRINKLAGSGVSAQNVASRQSAQYRTQLGLLSTTGTGALRNVMHIISYGPNDQNTATPRTKAEFKADLTTIANSIDTLSPSNDILFVAPPINLAREALMPMSEYQNAMFELAVERNCAFLNMQPRYGLDPAVYAFGGANPKMENDNLHPTGEEYVVAIRAALRGQSLA